VVYIVESSKSFYEACLDLGPVVQRLGFSVLQTHDLGELLQRAGHGLDEDCQVVDIVSPRLLEKALSADLRLSLGLPWRIAIFTEAGVTRIGLIRPTVLADCLGRDDAVLPLIQEVEDKMRQMVDETR
jgi:uncharacterized protein (DUF302 family)